MSEQAKPFRIDTHVHVIPVSLPLPFQPSGLTSPVCVKSQATARPSNPFPIPLAGEPPIGARKKPSAPPRHSRSAPPSSPLLLRDQRSLVLPRAVLN